MYLLTIQFILY